MWCKWRRRRIGMYNRYARTRGCATINLISCLHNLRNIFSRSLSRLSIIIFAWRKKRKLKNFLGKALNVFRDIVTHNWMCAIEITLKLVNNFSIFVQIDLTKRACYKKINSEGVNWLHKPVLKILLHGVNVNSHENKQVEWEGGKMLKLLISCC